MVVSGHYHNLLKTLVYILINFYRLSQQDNLVLKLKSSVNLRKLITPMFNPQISNLKIQ